MKAPPHGISITQRKLIETAMSGAIMLDALGAPAICGVSPRAESHFQDAFARIDGMRRTGSLLCDVTVVFGNGNHIKVR